MTSKLREKCSGRTILVEEIEGGWLLFRKQGHEFLGFLPDKKGRPNDTK